MIGEAPKSGATHPTSQKHFALVFKDSSRTGGSKTLGLNRENRINE